MAQKYWFAAKKYGWGWGLPLSWQGWAVYLSYLLVIIIDIALFPPHYKFGNFIGVLIVATLLLIAICFKKGEKLKWRWGKKK